MNNISYCIRTAQHSDIEHNDIKVQGNFRMMLFNTKYTKISTIRKLPAIRYLYCTAQNTELNTELRINFVFGLML